MATVDLSSPIPILAVPGVMIIPHASLSINVIDGRSRRMADDVLAGCGDDETLRGGSIAVASLPMGRATAAGHPSMRQAVCVTKVVRRQRRVGGGDSLLLAGACRARILALVQPDDDVPYQRAVLEAIPDAGDPVAQPAVRDLCELLANSRLNRLHDGRVALRMLRDGQVPSEAAIDIAGMMLVREDEDRYRLLSLASPRDRARVVWNALCGMDRLIRRADEQHPESWPKGMSWN